MTNLIIQNSKVMICDLSIEFRKETQYFNADYYLLRYNVETKKCLYYQPHETDCINEYGIEQTYFNIIIKRFLQEKMKHSNLNEELIKVLCHPNKIKWMTHRYYNNNVFQCLTEWLNIIGKNQL